MPAPVIGITADFDGERCRLAGGYARVVSEAGGLPLILPPLPDRAGALLDSCQGVILSGGDDPIMEPFGVRTHAAARPVHPQRQAFELALLAALQERPEVPVLGICLGMQLMGLHRGAALDQHLPETRRSAGDHYPSRSHPVCGSVGSGLVHSHHRQALSEPGDLDVAAEAPDGVIEAVRDARRPFYLGVQWHPERTADERLGRGLIGALVEAAAERN